MLVVAWLSALGGLICTEFSGVIRGLPEAVEGEDFYEFDLDDIRSVALDIEASLRPLGRPLAGAVACDFVEIR